VHGEPDANVLRPGRGRSGSQDRSPTATATTKTQLARAITHRYADLGGVRLHYVEAGQGPLVVLLHGFPEFWYTWRNQIVPLAEAGFRVIAPDLRGFNLSSKPAGVRSYGIRTVVEDIAGLIAATGAERAHVVGHDFGAGVTWSFAMQHPEMVSRIAVLNGPHPARLLQAMKSPVQLMKSWYVFFFQIPWLAEQVAQLDDFALFTKPLREEPLIEGAYDREDMALYVEALKRPGALEAMLGYYRAMFRPGTAIAMRPIEAPALVLWGVDDPHLGRELAAPPTDLVPHATVEYLDHATHWVQHDQPERVSARLIEFLSR
jgi:pimeloyl-ACP methyl ester carboxylesterase